MAQNVQGPTPSGKQRSTTHAYERKYWKAGLFRNLNMTGNDNQQHQGAILVVDDDEFSRDLMCRRLRRADFEPYAANDGVDAIRLIGEIDIDLVLLDVVMPGMDGREVLSAIRETRSSADLPVIMVTGKSEGAAIADCFANGANDYVTKPFEFSALTARIETHLARQRAEAALKRSQDELERRVEQRTAELSVANRELEDARNTLADALEAINEGFVLWDCDDRLVTCNQRYREFFGRNAELIVPGASFEALIRRQAESGALRGAMPDPESWLEKRLARHRNPEQPFEEEFSDGSWARVAETRASNGRIVGLWTNITETKRREIALKTFADTNRRLAAAVNATTSAVLITNANRKGNPTVFANPAFAAMTGWPIEEALGQDRKMLWGASTDVAVAEGLEEAMREGRDASAEIELYTRDGSPFWAEVHASPIYDNEGRISNWIIIQSDITARKETEEQLHQAQKMEMVGQLTGGLAHDFNNLLTVVLGSLEAAESSGGTQEAETQKLIEAALDATRRGAKLTKRMLAFARQQTLAPKITEIRESLDGFRDFLSRSIGKGYGINVLHEGEPWSTLVDPGQFENAVLNLAVNARDAMPDGGALTIESASQTLAGEIDIAGQPIANGEYVRVSVSDTGTGMPPEIARKAIQPFFTTKESGKGTGLGLSMVYGFVTQSGGAMRICDAPGAGARIELYFPRTTVRAEEPEASSDSDLTGRAETLLVVDDEPQVRAIAAMQLSRLGYTIIQASAAEEALELYDAQGPVDLLVTDIGLPGGMSGVDLAAAIRDRDPQARILFVSGYSDSASSDAAEQDSASVFLSKPYDRSALARAVREAISMEPAAAPPLEACGTA
jgi:PAS domain S-box-containing protein